MYDTKIREEAIQYYLEQMYNFEVSIHMLPIQFQASLRYHIQENGDNLCNDSKSLDYGYIKITAEKFYEGFPLGQRPIVDDDGRLGAA